MFVDGLLFRTSSLSKKAASGEAATALTSARHSPSESSKFGAPSTCFGVEGLGCKVHRLCVSLNSRLASSEEEEEGLGPHSGLQRGNIAKSKWLSVTLSVGTPLCPYGIAYCSVSSSSLISSLLHSHVNLEWCDQIKLSNLLLPWKSGTIKSLQLLSTSTTLLALEQLYVRRFTLPATTVE